MCVCVCALKTDQTVKEKEGEVVQKTQEMKQNTLVKIVIMYNVREERVRASLLPTFDTFLHAVIYLFFLY